jgi:hypothetical protein
MASSLFMPSSQTSRSRTSASSSRPSTSSMSLVTSNTHRLLGFRQGHVLILTNGFYKTGGETPPKHIKKSGLLRRRHETES